MQHITNQGFTLKHMDPFQSRAARAYFGECGNPGKPFATRLRLITFLKHGWML